MLASVVRALWGVRPNRVSGPPDPATVRIILALVVDAQLLSANELARLAQVCTDARAAVAEGVWRLHEIMFCSEFVSAAASFPGLREVKAEVQTTEALIDMFASFRHLDSLELVGGAAWDSVGSRVSNEVIDVLLPTLPQTLKRFALVSSHDFKEGHYFYAIDKLGQLPAGLIELRLDGCSLVGSHVESSEPRGVVRAIAALRFAPNLQILSLARLTAITSIVGIEALVSLEELYLNGLGQLETIAPAAALRHLRLVDLSGCSDADRGMLPSHVRVIGRCIDELARPAFCWRLGTAPMPGAPITTSRVGSEMAMYPGEEWPSGSIAVFQLNMREVPEGLRALLRVESGLLQLFFDYDDPEEGPMRLIPEEDFDQLVLCKEEPMYDEHVPYPPRLVTGWTKVNDYPAGRWLDRNLWGDEAVAECHQRHLRGCDKFGGYGVFVQYEAHSLEEEAVILCLNGDTRGVDEDTIALPDGLGDAGTGNILESDFFKLPLSKEFRNSDFSFSCC